MGGGEWILTSPLVAEGLEASALLDSWLLRPAFLLWPPAPGPGRRPRSGEGEGELAGGPLRCGRLAGALLTLRLLG